MIEQEKQCATQHPTYPPHALIGSSPTHRLTGKSLADTSAIALDGAPPHPVSVSLAPETPDAASYGLGDVIRLAVTFDKNVTVTTGDGGSTPVLVLDCKREREAFFDGGGNGSTTLYFQYEVNLFFVCLFCVVTILVIV